MLPITYEYKIYQGGVFLGDLPSVTSQFSYSQDINNGAAPMTLECNVPLTVADQPLPTIDTELGEPIQMESGENFEMESAPVLFGASGSSSLIANNNNIVVYEFSPDYPNGKKVYAGWITNWNIQHKAGKISIDCISYGMDLNDYLVVGGITTDQSQTAQDSWAKWNDGYPNPSFTTQFVQSFKLGAGSTIPYIDLYMRDGLFQTYGLNGGGRVDIALYSAIGGTLLDTATATLTGGSLGSIVRFNFASLPSLVAGTTYYLYINTYSGSGNGAPDFAFKNSDVLANGNLNAVQLSVTTPMTADLYMVVYTGGANATSATFSSTDPTLMLRTIIDNYVAAGGRANYAAGTTDLTGLTLSYTYITARVLDGIKKVLDLAPANFYWTVDPATQTLYFKQYNTTADILLTLGQNIEDLQLGINSEGVRNVVYFTGGATAGVNLLKKYTSASSIATNGRQRLETLSDNRVTNTTTADAIGSAFLGANASEVYQTSVILGRNVTDITTVRNGQTVGFSGFGNFIDNLILNVVRVTRYYDRVELTLGTIPPRASSTLRDLQNQVEELQTVANPATSS